MTVAIVLCSCAAAPDQITKPAHESPRADQHAPFWQEVPGTAFKFEMLPAPGDEANNIKPFYIARTELTWEAFDVFVYRLDADDDAAVRGADAVTRPSKPYLPPDRGYGHDGFAAIGMSHQTATEYCKWLSAKTGRRYRLPTEAEWERACRAGSASSYCFGDNAAALGDYAWFSGNAGGVPHAVGGRKPNAWGLHDMHGNIAEWANDRDGKPITCGGSYRDDSDHVKATSRAAPQPSWNATDPQIPKSQWWLADAPFVGFRVVCESDSSAGAARLSHDSPNNNQQENDHEHRKPSNP